MDARSLVSLFETMFTDHRENVPAAHVRPAFSGRSAPLRTLSLGRNGIHPLDVGMCRLSDGSLSKTHGEPAASVSLHGNGLRLTDGRCLPLRQQAMDSGPSAAACPGASMCLRAAAPARDGPLPAEIGWDQLPADTARH